MSSDARDVVGTLHSYRGTAALSDPVIERWVHIQHVCRDARRAVRVSRRTESSARVAPRGEQRACGAMMAACAARRRWSGSLWERYAALGHGPDVLRAAASELQREAGARPRVVVSYAGLLSVYEAAVLAAQRVHVAWGGLATPVRV
jgi:hypothetical protein